MRRYCYVDMDGFFAAAEQHLRPELRGVPVGVYAGVPGRPGGALISVSAEAKRLGVKSGQLSREARERVPALEVVAQRPDRYIELHHALIGWCEGVAPVLAVHSVDELSFRLSGRDIPSGFMAELRGAVPVTLPFSAGVAASVWLAKVAAESGKPKGATDWTRPGALPEAVFELDLDDLPGIGPRLLPRLDRYGIRTVQGLYEASLTRAREAFGSIEGERIWLGLHGHDVRWPRPGPPRHFSHGRVLGPKDRAKPILRWLALCAWQRARDARLRPARLRVDAFDGTRWWGVRGDVRWPCSERQVMGAASAAWRILAGRCRSVTRLWVTLGRLVPDFGDLFAGEERDLVLEDAMDRIREKYGQRAVVYGNTRDERGRYTGLKIAFGRVPSVAEVRRLLG